MMSGSILSEYVEGVERETNESVIASEYENILISLTPVVKKPSACPADGLMSFLRAPGPAHRARIDAAQNACRMCTAWYQQ